MITLHLDGSTAKEPFGRPLRLHLRFENRHLTDCPGRTGGADGAQEDHFEDVNEMVFQRSGAGLLIVHEDDFPAAVKKLDRGG